MSITDDIDEVRARIGMRRPARFRIKRLKLTVSAEWPWRVADSARPGVYGHAKTHQAAVRLVGGILEVGVGVAFTLIDEAPPAHVVAYVTGAPHA